MLTMGRGNAEIYGVTNYAGTAIATDNLYYMLAVMAPLNQLIRAVAEQELCWDEVRFCMISRIVFSINPVFKQWTEQMTTNTILFTCRVMGYR